MRLVPLLKQGNGDFLLKKQYIQNQLCLQTLNAVSMNKEKFIKMSKQVPDLNSVSFCDKFSNEYVHGVQSCWKNWKTGKTGKRLVFKNFAGKTGKYMLFQLACAGKTGK